MAGPPRPASGGGRSSDFNGDGFDDLAIGVPGESLAAKPGASAGTSQAGMVNILMGGADGMEASPVSISEDEFDTTGFSTAVEGLTRIGKALAAGDFDGDGFADLAVGGRARVDGEFGAGIVCVYFGSASGIDLGRAPVLLHQNVTDVDGTAQQGDHFGDTLCTGDFDDDGIADLVVGVPAEGVGGVGDTGCIHVFPGKAGVGPSAALEFSIDQNSTNDTFHNSIEGSCQAGDGYGSALCAIDFDGDGIDDLAVGIPSEDLGSIANAGSVNVIFGFQAMGLRPLDNLSLEQGVDFSEIDSDDGALLRNSQANDRWGSALAAGSFEDVAQQFLVIGIPGKTVFGASGAGAVGVVQQSSGGGAPRLRYICQDGLFDGRGVEDNADSGELFGFAVAAGDFDHDGDDDIAVGVPLEDTVATFPIDFRGGEGAVHVFKARRGSIMAFSGKDGGDRLITQSTSGISGKAEEVDFFGGALAVGNFLGGNTVDLVVGAPFETLHDGTPDEISQAGAVFIIKGTNTSNGLSQSFSNNESFDQTSTGMPGRADTEDDFGMTLAGR